MAGNGPFFLNFIESEARQLFAKPSELIEFIEGWASVAKILHPVFVVNKHNQLT